MVYRQVIGATSYVFDDLRELLAKATPARRSPERGWECRRNDRGADGARKCPAEAVPE